MSRFKLAELKQRSILSARDEADATYYAINDFYFQQSQISRPRASWKIVGVRVESSGSNKEHEAEAIKLLRQSNVMLMYGPNIYFVTIEAALYLEITDESAGDNAGLDQEPGVSVAGDSEGASDGGTDSLIGGFPTEA